ncbi:uncharacterized protein LOC110025978 [Phalaenopsis equestris]|uniref:uncharacterized protein LOC110025978 n=1 Tax=Phalaenopsis equestris TaxID=78828 RepID=UPI0009E5F31D|nr:uncharacterized protein LOC110025978 [Phalaenopsis equestris]
MKDHTIAEYLMVIRSLVDHIAVASSQLDAEEVILYILNGMPPSYNAFKIVFHTSLQLIALDNLYSFLCSEEVNINNDISMHQPQTESPIALAASRGCQFTRSKGRGRMTQSNQRGGHGGEASGGRTTPKSNITCQICHKTGHSSASC